MNLIKTILECKKSKEQKGKKEKKRKEKAKSGFDVGGCRKKKGWHLPLKSLSLAWVSKSYYRLPKYGHKQK